jgi:hypothetical protein
MYHENYGYVTDDLIKELGLTKPTLAMSQECVTLWLKLLDKRLTERQLKIGR